MGTFVGIQNPHMHEIQYMHLFNISTPDKKLPSNNYIIITKK